MPRVCALLLVGLWDSRVLSGSSLSVFAAHWKRLLHHLDAEMRVFELLPLERPDAVQATPTGVVEVGGPC